LRAGRRQRVAVLIALGALVVAGAAYGLTSLGGSGNAATSWQQAWIGLQMEYSPTGGAMIAVVDPGSPAENAGLQAGDVITGVDGQPVAAPADVTQTIDSRRPGDALAIQVQRGLATYTTQVTLTARPSGLAYP
jgi:S1-C subfamily serine protease